MADHILPGWGAACCAPTSKFWRHRRECLCCLEGELELEVDAAVGARGRKGARGEGVGLAEEGRAENAVGRGEIDDIEDVACGDAEGEIVRTIRPAAAHPEGAASIASTAGAVRMLSAASAWAATARSAIISARSGIGIGGFHLFAEAKCFAQAYVERKARVGGAVVDGNDLLARNGNGVEGAEAGGDHVGRIRKTAGKCGTAVEHGGAVEVGGHGDIE